jgi:uncharacterized protein YbjT (DUF2867 family)
LIAGATGYVGRNVVAEALRAGHEVIAHVRPESGSGDDAADSFSAAGARVVRTPWTAVAWRQQLAEDAPERLFLLLGTTAARARAAAQRGVDASQQTVDLGLTMLAVTAARSVSPEIGLVYLSALGASPTGNEYLRVRATVEAALVSGANPFTVVRPSFITGPDRGEARLGERIGALVGDAACAVLRTLGARRLAARWASITGPSLATILVTLATEPLDRRVHELDDFRR